MTSDDTSQRESLLERLILTAVVIAAVALVSFAKSRIFGPFELDELGTTWFLSGSFADLIHRSIALQIQGPLYFLLLKVWAWALPQPGAEWFLRLPSVFFAAGTLALIYQIGARLWSPLAGAVALGLLGANTQFLSYALHARPYSCALFLCALAMLQLLDFLRTGRRRNLFGYWAACSAMLATHYFYVLVLPVHALAVFFLGRRFPDYRKRAALLAALMLATFGVFGCQLLRIVRAAPQLSFVPVPSAWDLGRALASVECGATLGVFGLAFLLRIGRASNGRKDAWKAPTIALCWWLLPILVVWLVSHRAANSIWLDRYYSPALLGAALFWALLISERLRGFSPRAVPYIFLFICCAVYLGSVPARGSPSGWRAAMTIIRDSEAGERECPIMIMTSFVEAANEAAWKNGELKGFFEAPIDYYYPGAARVVLPWSMQLPWFDGNMLAEMRKQLADASCAWFVGVSSRLKIGGVGYEPMAEEVGQIVPHLVRARVEFTKPDDVIAVLYQSPNK